MEKTLKAVNGFNDENTMQSERLENATFGATSKLNGEKGSEDLVPMALGSFADVF